MMTMIVFPMSTIACPQTLYSRENNAFFNVITPYPRMFQSYDGDLHQLKQRNLEILNLPLPRIELRQ